MALDIGDEQITIDYYDDDRTSHPFRSLYGRWCGRTHGWSVVTPSADEDLIDGSSHQLLLVPRGPWTRRPAGVCRGLASLSVPEAEELADVAVRLGVLVGLKRHGVYRSDFHRRWLPTSSPNDDLSWRAVVKAATPQTVVTSMVGSYLLDRHGDATQEWVAVGLEEASRVTYESRLLLGPGAADVYGEELTGVPYHIGLHDMVENARRARMRAWPFLDEAQPLRALMEMLQRVGPDLEGYRVFFRHRPPAAHRPVAEQNSHGIDGNLTVYYEHFFELNPACGLSLDSLLTRGHLPGWQRLADALARRRGSSRDHAGFFSFKRPREEDDEAEAGPGESQSSGAVLPDN